MKKLSLLKLNRQDVVLSEGEISKIFGGCSSYNCQCSGSWESATYNGGTVSGSQVVSVTLSNRSSSGTL